MGHGYQYIVSAKLSLDNCREMPKFINKAYSGATMNQLYKKWNEDVIENTPSVLSILCGTNDAVFGYNNGFSVEKTADYFCKNLNNAVRDTLKANSNTKIIILEPFYFPLQRTGLYDFTAHPYCEEPFKRPDDNDTDELVKYRLEAMNQIRNKSKKVADENNCTYVKLYNRFKSEINKSKAEYFTWDGTHPDIAGHMLIAEEWLKATEEL